MGEIEIIENTRNLYIHSHIVIYGNAAKESLAKYISDEIAELWSEPKGKVILGDTTFTVSFISDHKFMPDLKEEDILFNNNPRNNYFRIEDYAKISISFVDDIGCNTGYFITPNLYEGSTTAAHEFGHTLGLRHPTVLDIRGKGRPGIMYPRGTLVDPEFQYNPEAKFGENLSTMNPMCRRVKQSDIDNLNLAQIIYNNDLVVGNFTNRFHREQINPNDNLVG